MLSRKQRIILFILVVMSVLLCLFIAALCAGYAHPIQNSDSKGNPLGFNNPMTWELYGILLRSASMASVARILGWYGGIYLLSHFIALLILANKTLPKAKRLIALAFFLQGLLFPFGLLNIYFSPFLIRDFFAGKIDGETLTDIPFWCLFQGSWILVSMLAGILIWKSARKNL